MVTGQQKRDRHMSQMGSNEHQIARIVKAFINLKTP